MRTFSNLLKTFCFLQIVLFSSFSQAAWTDSKPTMYINDRVCLSQISKEIRQNADDFCAAKALQDGTDHSCAAHITGRLNSDGGCDFYVSCGECDEVLDGNEEDIGEIEDPYGWY